jgi:excisionase family DNA binding protein
VPRPALDSRPTRGLSQRTDSPNLQNSGLPMLLTPAEAARQLSMSRWSGLSRWSNYELIKDRRLRAVYYGRLKLIHRSELERFASSLEQK